MFAFSRRTLLVFAILVILLLTAFAALALLGPEDPCVNAVDFCDPAL